jgi:dethiobiotin synthetase
MIRMSLAKYSISRVCSYSTGHHQAKLLLRCVSSSSTTTPTLAAEEDEEDVVAADPNTRFWKKRGGRYQRPIFVAATKQHVGKTTTSLAIISGLQKRFDKVGFLKPVGQQHVDVHSDNLNKTLKVDKDVWLVREHFHLNHIDYEDMSPVIIPNGYTKKYVDGMISHEQQLHDIEMAMRHVSDASDVVVCEGTGHCAVGSIVNVNNAKVASLIGADMVLVANGGLGELTMLFFHDKSFAKAGDTVNPIPLLTHDF